MAVRAVNVPVTLRGVSQKSPPDLSMPGEMTNAINVQILKGADRGVEFSKRYGTVSARANTNSLLTAVNPRHMVTLGESLVLDNDQAVFARDLAQNAWLTYQRNGFNFTSSTDVISQSLYQKTTPAYAYDAASGNELIAWYDQADQVRFSVRSREIGDWSAHEAPMGASSSFVATYKVQAFAPGDGFFYVIAPSFTGASLAITKINVFNPSAAAPNFFLSYDAQHSQWDAQLTPEGTFLIAIKSIAATTTAVLIWSPVTDTVVTSTTIATTALGNAAWLSQSPFASGAARRYYLATADTTNGILLWTFDGNLTSLGSIVEDATHSTDIRANLVGWYDTVHLVARVFVDNQTPGFFYIAEAGASYMRQLIFASKAFLLGGVWYVLTRINSVVQPTLFLVDLANKRVVGKVEVEGSQWQNFLYAPGLVPWVTQIGTQFVVPAMAAHTALGQSTGIPIGTQIQGISLVTFDSAGPTSKPVELGGVLHYPGSIPWIFDGAQAVESGFNLYPESVRPSDAGSGTSKTPAASYGYRATYVWRDAAGNVYESAPSPVVNYLAVNADDIDVFVQTLPLTNRVDVMINLYRNDPVQPTVFRLVNAAPVLNDKTTDFVTILDNLADLTINADWATRALLYNGDGENGQPVEHIPPPSHTIVATAQNRTFLAGIDQDPAAVWFSNEVLPGQGVSYFDGFVFRIVGIVSAVVGRDRNVVVFTEDSIWTVTGEFPDNAGGSFQIPTPFKLPHQLGAIDSNSLVVASIGIFFQSQKGLHILGWDWSVSYIGGGIEDTLGAQSITSGLEVPSLHQVRLYTARGATLVWDTVFSMWTTFAGQPALVACNWRGVPCYVGTDAVLHQEVPSSYGDDGAFVQSTLEFAIMAPADLRGYFCLFALQLLGQVKGPHQLNASLGYNSQNFPTTLYQAPVAGVDVYGDVVYGVGTYGGDGDNVLKMEIRPKKRQSSAYELVLWDTLLSSGASEGFTLEAVTASIGVESGLARTQASQRMIKI